MVQENESWQRTSSSIASYHRQYCLLEHYGHYFSSCRSWHHDFWYTRSVLGMHNQGYNHTIVTVAGFRNRQDCLGITLPECPLSLKVPWVHPWSPFAYINKRSASAVSIERQALQPSLYLRTRTLTLPDPIIPLDGSQIATAVVGAYAL